MWRKLTSKFVNIVGNYGNSGGSIGGGAWCRKCVHLSSMYNRRTIRAIVMGSQYKIEFVISVQKAWTKSSRAIARRKVSAPTYLAVAAAQDLPRPLGNILTLSVSQCAPVVFNAFLAFSVHCHCVVCILGGTCTSSLIAIVTSCESTDLSIARAHGRVQSIHISYSSEHSRS